MMLLPSVAVMRCILLPSRTRAHIEKRKNSTGLPILGKPGCYYLFGFDLAVLQEATNSVQIVAH